LGGIGNIRAHGAAPLAAMLLGIAALPPAWPITLKKQGERKRAPQFELKDPAGRIVRLSDYAGKVVVLDFWATWCGPCKNSIPWLIELSKKHEADGLAVIGISMDEDGWEVVKPFIEQMRIPYPIVLGTERVAYLYGEVDSLPLAFFVDRSQRVAAIHLGPASRKEFEKTIRQLLDGER
jgi:cytochrome c biogenesis protein CcmG/thiol:disulfide interchange protein DsbE